MTRTSPWTLLVLAAVGAMAGFGLNHMLTVMGKATFVPSVYLPVLLVIIGASSVALAWPVRQSTRGNAERRIDPFKALRAVTLARASSILGALLCGVGVGLLLFLLSRPLAPQVGSVVSMVALAGGALLLVIAGLVAEQFCTLPKDPDDRQLDDAADA